MPDLEPYHITEAAKIAGDITTFLRDNHSIARIDPEKGEIKIIMGATDLKGYYQSISLAERRALEGCTMPGHHTTRSTSTTVSHNLEGGRKYHKQLVFFPDIQVIETVDGNLENRAIFVEELSHALFSYDQLARGHSKPHQGFLELIGALDKINYQLCENPSMREQVAASKVVHDATKAYHNPSIIHEGEDYYYFAHKWAYILHNTLLYIRQRDRLLAKQLYTSFYEGTDGDRLYLLMYQIQKLCNEKGVHIPGFKAYDPNNPMEPGLFRGIVRAINDPRIRIA